MPTPNTPNPLPYQFDSTGHNPDNLVVNEKHPITLGNFQDYHVIIPKYAPFFEASVKVKFTASGSGVQEKILTKGEDYYFGYYFAEASLSEAVPVSSAIVLNKRDNTGTLTIEYQTLGGDWLVTEEKILQVLADRIHNPRTVYWEQVVDLPYRFPVTNHDFNVKDLYGQKELVASILKVADVIMRQTASNYTKDKIDQLLAEHRRTVNQDVTTKIATEINNYNPILTNNSKKYIAEEIIKTTKSAFEFTFSTDESSAEFAKLKPVNNKLRPNLGLIHCDRISATELPANAGWYAVYNGESGNHLDIPDISDFTFRYPDLHERDDLFTEFNNLGNTNDTYQVFREEKIVYCTIACMRTFITGVLEGRVNWYTGNNSWIKGQHPVPGFLKVKSGMVDMLTKIAYNQDTYWASERNKYDNWNKKPLDQIRGLVDDVTVYRDKTTNTAFNPPASEKESRMTNGQWISSLVGTPIWTSNDYALPFRMYIRHCKVSRAQGGYIYPIVVVTLG